MEPDKQPVLKPITNKHLLDARSDKVYTPFRDLTQRVFSQKYLIPQSQYNQLSKISDQSLLPAKVEALEITKQPVNSFKKFRKIAERQKQYERIEEGVLKKMLQQSKGPETVVYKYSELQQNSGKLRIAPVTKIAQNRLHLSDKFEEKLQIIGKRNQKEHSYNLFSFLDEPLYHIRKKL